MSAAERFLEVWTNDRAYAVQVLRRMPARACVRLAQQVAEHEGKTQWDILRLWGDASHSTLSTMPRRESITDE